MRKCLLSVDWDYFIYTQRENWNSYMETGRSVVNLWYKRYINSKMQGNDIRKSFQLSSEADVFWDKIKNHFKFLKGVKAYVSDSHALSYDIAKEQGCDAVYLFDAHSDLGYGGLASLNFEVNCANWLGKLLKDKEIAEAYIIYSPFTFERPKDFKPMNDAFNIWYTDFGGLNAGIEISAVHICRSGTWTPPWFDERFRQFVNAAGIPYEIINCPERKWDTEHLSFSDQINYLMA